MKGYVLIEKGVAEWRDIPTPEIGEDEALVRPTAVATCTTDVELIATARWKKAIGRVIGHEGVGIVEKVGSQVKDFKPGDRVVLPSAGSDFRHPRAQRGEAKYFQNNNTYITDKPGVGGVFSEYVKVIDANARMAHIPDVVTDIQAVMVPDMVVTGFSGVQQMHILFGETVLVLGCGPVGLMGIIGAVLKGAGKIIAVGSRPKTLELARAYGATHVIDYKQGPIYDQVMELTGGQQVDHTLIASGGSASEIFSTALKLTKYGGYVANVSLFMDEDSVTIPLDVWNYGCREKFLTGIAVNDGRDSFERLLAMIASKRFDPSPLVTHQLYGWEKIDEGLNLMRNHDPSVIKPVIIPD